MARSALSISILINILLWMPVKSLVRFKSVCKQWSGLIGNSGFVAEHLNHSTFSSNNGGLLVKSRNGLRDKDVFLLLSEETFIITQYLGSPYFNEDLRVELEMLGSCNGIICLNDKRFKHLALWNPATREIKALPKSCIAGLTGLRLKVSGVGFGFDVNTNDYKVVRITWLVYDDGRQQPHQVEVYRLTTHSWRIIDAPVPVSYIKPDIRPKAYLNGIYYWLAKHNIKDETMLAFDICNEVFRTTPLPIVCTVNFYATYEKRFAVLNDSIALILFSCVEAKFFETWVLNEYGSGDLWTKLYTFGPILGCPWPLGFSNDGKLFLERQEVLVLSKNHKKILKDQNQLGLCNPFTRVVTNLPVEGESGSLEVLVYKESLVSFKHE